METNSNWKGITVVCATVCLSAPIAISVLTMTFGATEWREDDEPVPIAAHTINALFLFDLFATGLLIWLMQRWRGVTAIIAISLLCLTGYLAFWGGLWVSGQWL
jgi:hypothetical protein